MENNLSELARQGQDVFQQVSQSIRTLDFEGELGERLSSCADGLAALAGSEIADISDLDPIAEELGARLYRSYTMAQERNLHHSYLPAGTSGSAARVPLKAVAAHDDALF